MHYYHIKVYVYNITQLNWYNITRKSSLVAMVAKATPPMKDKRSVIIWLHNNIMNILMVQFKDGKTYAGIKLHWVGEEDMIQPEGGIYTWNLYTIFPYKINHKFILKNDGKNGHMEHPKVNDFISALILANI